MTRPVLVSAALLALLSAGCLGAPGPGDDARWAGRDGAAAEAGPGCIGASGGGGASAGQSAGAQSGVSNEPGQFAYGGQATLKLGTERYTWTNHAPVATLAWGGQTTTGTFTLVVEDACGVEVWRGDASALSQESGYERTTRGTAGDWTLTLQFTAYTGQMGLWVASG